MTQFVNPSSKIHTSLPYRISAYLYLLHLIVHPRTSSAKLHFYALSSGRFVRTLVDTLFPWTLHLLAIIEDLTLPFSTSQHSNELVKGTSEIILLQWVTGCQTLDVAKKPGLGERRNAHNRKRGESKMDDPGCGRRHDGVRCH